LKEWVSGLPYGVNTYHSSTLSDDGVLPSGGQAQKIALARSLAHAGPFVIMDEPTAALDPKSEEEIFHQMLTLSEHTTSLFISHRLSSTRYADRILVLDRGRIVEQGSHRELLANGRLYARMYEAQAALYR
jgi:ABC-type multidrug transport system fused ATPase/permease subunit